MRVVNKSNNPMPTYQTEGAVGVDLQANEDVSIKAFGRMTVKTGLYVEVPDGLEMQIRSRSGLGAKHGIAVILGVGTIDQDYRGEIMVPLINHTEHTFEIKKGDRIAQAVLSPVATRPWESAETLSETDRGEGGFGSTGK